MKKLLLMASLVAVPAVHAEWREVPGADSRSFGFGGDIVLGNKNNIVRLQSGNTGPMIRFEPESTFAWSGTAWNKVADSQLSLMKLYPDGKSLYAIGLDFDAETKRLALKMEETKAEADAQLFHEHMFSEQSVVTPVVYKLQGKMWKSITRLLETKMGIGQERILPVAVADGAIWGIDMPSAGKQQALYTWESNAWKQVVSFPAGDFPVADRDLFITSNKEIFLSAHAPYPSKDLNLWQLDQKSRTWQLVTVVEYSATVPLGDFAVGGLKHIWLLTREWKDNQGVSIVSKFDLVTKKFIKKGERTDIYKLSVGTDGTVWATTENGKILEWVEDEEIKDEEKK